MIDFKSRPLISKLALLFSDCTDLLTDLEELNRIIGNDSTVRIISFHDELTVDVNNLLPGLEATIKNYEKELLQKNQEIKTLIYGNEFLQSNETSETLEG